MCFPDLQAIALLGPELGTSKCSVTVTLVHKKLNASIGVCPKDADLDGWPLGYVPGSVATWSNGVVKVGGKNVRDNLAKWGVAGQQLTLEWDCRETLRVLVDGALVVEHSDANLAGCCFAVHGINGTVWALEVRLGAIAPFAYGICRAADGARRRWPMACAVWHLRLCFSDAASSFAASVRSRRTGPHQH